MNEAAIIIAVLAIVLLILIVLALWEPISDPLDKLDERHFDRTPHRDTPIHLNPGRDE